MIKHFEEFRTDDDGTFYYYDDEKNENQWSYDLNELGKYIIKNEQEIERLQNIIDELEKYLNNKIMGHGLADKITGSYWLGYGEYIEILDKLQELKGNETSEIEKYYNGEIHVDFEE